MTIKEHRERDARRLAEKLNPNPTPEEIEAARHALRLFYRFVAAYQRSFYTANDRRYTDAERAAADEKSERSYKKASEALRFYNCLIACPGLYPIIDNDNKTNFSYGFFYR